MQFFRRLSTRAKSILVSTNNAVKRWILYVLSASGLLRLLTAAAALGVSAVTILAAWSPPLIVWALLSLAVSAVILFILFHVYSLAFPVETRANFVVRSLETEPDYRKLLHLARQYRKWIKKDIVRVFKVLPTDQELRHGLELINSDYHENRYKIKRLVKKLETRDLSRLKETARRRAKHLALLMGKMSKNMEIDPRVIEETLGYPIGFVLEVLDRMLEYYKEIKRDLRMRISSKEAWDDTTVYSYTESQLPTLLLDVNDPEHAFRVQEKRLDLLLSQYSSKISSLLELVVEPSTGRAVRQLAKLLIKVADEKELKTLLGLANCRQGFPLALLLGFSGNLESWHGKQIDGKTIKNDIHPYLKMTLNSSAGVTDRVVNNFLVHLTERLQLKQVDTTSERGKTVVIALTYGYSSVLLEVLSGLLGAGLIEGVRLTFVTASDDSTYEDLFANQLRERVGNIFQHNSIPYYALKDRGEKIQIVFVGIEAINLEGCLVHPRGSIDIISEIQGLGNKVDFYALGESFKVKDFIPETLNHEKLSVVSPEVIDFVITDCAVHHKQGDVFDLKCCFDLHHGTENKLVGA